MKRLSLFLSAILSSIYIQAQYYEVGAYVGTSNYVGDLSEQRFSPEGFGGMLGVLGRYNFTKYLSAKASLTKGTVAGDDAHAKAQVHKDRNLSFRSDILELAATGELNLSAYNIRANKTGVPYLFAGLALMHFNPQAQMRGTWYDLQPLQTEGKQYSRLAVAVPFGVGMKFNLSYKLNFGFEIGARKTFTDYLDDVSTHYPDVINLRRTDPTTASLSYRTPEITGEFGENPMGSERGDPSTKDWYFFGGITFTVNLTDKYGLDFDPQYEVFKEHLEKPEKDNPSVSKRKKKAKFQKKFRLKKQRNELQPQVKKRSH
jgi:hypothetical protein